MKYSTKLSDAIHILVLIATNTGATITSADIAYSIHTNPGFIRQIMMTLRKGDILAPSVGRAKPILARAPKEITLCEIYKAVEGEKPLLHLDTHTNPACGVGVNIQYAIQDYYTEVQYAAESKMKEITLQDIIDSYQKKAENFILPGIN